MGAGFVSGAWWKEGLSGTGVVSGLFNVLAGIWSIWEQCVYVSNIFWSEHLQGAEPDTRLLYAPNEASGVRARHGCHKQPQSSFV